MLHVKVVNCQDGNCATSPVTYDCLLVRCYAPKKGNKSFYYVRTKDHQAISNSLWFCFCGVKNIFNLAHDLLE